MFCSENSNILVGRGIWVLKQAVLVAWVLVVVTTSARADIIGWNPHPHNDDVVFSLPCGQGIVFRKIVTETGADSGDEQILDDRRVRFGTANSESAYIDYLRSDFIAGHFKPEGEKFYLLGKYETTIGQYKALVDAVECDLELYDDRLPASNVSWYDAVEFGRRLTGYLLKNHSEKLVEVLGTDQVLARLPTEAEWEFAVRGGIGVSVAKFQAFRFFSAGRNLGVYALYNSPVLQATEADEIGVRDPNDLKLYDVYGNLLEMMLEPFRLNKAGRPHGMAGGLILRGGSFKSRAAYVNSSSRIERPLFDARRGDESRYSDTGFRIALTGLALPTSAAVNQLAEEWDNSSSARLTDGVDPLDLLEDLQSFTSDIQLNNDLTTIEQWIRTENGRNIEQQQRVLDDLLFSAGAFVQEMRDLFFSFKNMRKLYNLQEGVLDQKVRSSIRQRILDDEEKFYDLLYIVHEVLVRISNSYEFEELEKQASSVVGDLLQRQHTKHAKAVEVIVSIVSFSNLPGNELSREVVLKQSVLDLRE